MFKHVKKTIQYGANTLTLETGEIARQAGGAVLVSLGDTVVLVTAQGAKAARVGQDFFPRPSEKETLTSRLIDRPIRPLFPEGFYNEVQVIATVMSVDPEVDPDIAAMIGASAALAISGLPFDGPIGAARVAYVDGQYVLNPTKTELLSSQLNLVVAGTEAAVLMVESEANELPEEIMLGAVVFGHEQMQVAIKAIAELAAEAGKPRWTWAAPAVDTALRQAVAAQAESALGAAYSITEKQQRYARVNAIKSETTAALSAGDPPKFTAEQIGEELFLLESRIVRERILGGQPRIACARLGAVHARRNPGAGYHHARHHPRCTDHRCARRRASRTLHAALQLPAVLGR